MHFYAKRPEQSNASIFTMASSDHAFCPEKKGVLMLLRENRDTIAKILNDIPDIHGPEANDSVALGAAIDSAFQTIKEQGGKIVVLTTKTPDVGLMKFG